MTVASPRYGWLVALVLATAVWAMPRSARANIEVLIWGPAVLTTAANISCVAIDHRSYERGVWCRVIAPLLGGVAAVPNLLIGVAVADADSVYGSSERWTTVYKASFFVAAGIAAASAAVNVIHAPPVIRLRKTAMQLTPQVVGSHDGRAGPGLALVVRW